jgi:hypothetical protein
VVSFRPPGELALALRGQDPRQVLFQGAELFHAVGLSHLNLEPQAKKLLAGLALLGVEFGAVEIADFPSLHSSPPE